RRCHLKERLFRQRTKTDGTSLGQRPDMPDGMVKIGNLNVCDEVEFVRKRLPIQSDPCGLSYRTVTAIAADQIFRRERLAGGETDSNTLLFLFDRFECCSKFDLSAKFRQPFPQNGFGAMLRNQPQIGIRDGFGGLMPAS